MVPALALLAASAPGTPIGPPPRRWVETRWDGVHASASPGHTLAERSPLWGKYQPIVPRWDAGPNNAATAAAARLEGHARAAELREARRTASVGLSWKMEGQ